MTDATFCVTFDFDAVSAWMAWDRPEYAPWGVFGAEVAAPRLLDVLDRFDVPSTWFVPGHTIESFPEVCADVWAAGHDVQHHGFTHRAPKDYGSREAEAADFERGIEAVESLTGRAPTGYRAPAGGFSEHTPDLLVEYGFEWDSSGSNHDFRPYELHTDPHFHVSEPYEPGEPTGLVEIPYAWHRDDWLQIFPVVSKPTLVSYSMETEVFDRWRAEIEWMRANVEDGVYVFLLHPQCAGRAPFLSEFEPLLEELAGDPDVEFATLDAVASRVREDVL